MEAHTEMERFKPGLCALSTALGCLSALPATLLTPAPPSAVFCFFLVFRFPAILLFVLVPEEANLSSSPVTAAAATSEALPLILFVSLS